MTGIETVLVVFICILALFDVYILFKIKAVIGVVDTHNRALAFMLKHCRKYYDESNSVKKS